ncbi:MAG: phosphoribosylamine--glycine ligase [Flavobacteriaceae bacterium]|nr:phosphoribosylamine--glycine ligase [Flavobacteriaceae bacterium]
MNILLLGSGGREHALALKMRESSLLSKLYIAPGNAGTISVGTNLDIDINNFNIIKENCLKLNIEMIVVGPEAPLVNGIHDFIKEDNELKHIGVVGPKKLGATLEGSKDFSKIFMEKHNIPTAKYKSFTKENLQEGYKFLETLSPPFVLKADGLAAGKGVLILDKLSNAKEELKDMLCNSKFGEASTTVVIEEFLKGIELSVFVLTDGTNYKILPSAKDYKRIGEGDTGLNTGGMGAISPVPFADKDFLDKVEERVIKPTINGFKKDNIDYKGFIFIGLMNMNGDPFVIEYNVRMGDPETEVVIPRLKSDLVDLFLGVVNGDLDKKELIISDEIATTIMAVSGGYPEAYDKNIVITGLENITGSTVYHAGTKQVNGEVLTNGGRVLSVTSMGNSIEETLEKSYKNLGEINYKGKYYRKDIGQDLIKNNI